MYEYCKSCVHDKGNIGFCDKCCYTYMLRKRGLPPTEYEAEQKPITNADRIRSMTDEELAEYLAPCACPPIRFNKNTGDIVCPVNKEPSASDCKSCWLDWLREEADHD